MGAKINKNMSIVIQKSISLRRINKLRAKYIEN